jgi:hypothetical protein
MTLIGMALGRQETAEGEEISAGWTGCLNLLEGKLPPCGDSHGISGIVGLPPKDVRLVAVEQVQVAGERLWPDSM